MWAKLTAALDGQGLPSPSPTALRDLRRRIGAAPLKALFEVLAGPVAQPSTPGVAFGRYRTVAFDGCTSVKVPDTPRYQALRRAMVTAVETVPGTDRASFTTALQTAIDTVTGADGVVTSSAPDPGRIGRAVLHDLLPPRRPRVSVRKVKSPLSRWNKADPHRPARSTPVTAMDITVHHPQTPQPATRRQPVTQAADGIVARDQAKAKRRRVPGPDRTGLETENAHGSPDRSAAAAAPQEVSSKITASGCSAPIACCRSAACGWARSPNWLSALIRAPNRVRARQSPGSTHASSGASRPASMPAERIRPASAAPLRTTILWPRLASSCKVATSGYRRRERAPGKPGKSSSQPLNRELTAASNPAAPTARIP